MFTSPCTDYATSLPTPLLPYSPTQDNILDFEQKTYSLIPDEFFEDEVAYFLTFNRHPQ